MKINVLTLFPEMFTAVTDSSILGRAGEQGILDFNIINIRDFSKDRHNKADDTPFGGGVGMVMFCQPIFDALRSINAEGKKIMYMSPRGKVLDQDKIEELAGLDEMVILCGHYEGVDQRVLDYWNMEEVSIGDYILTGGELAAAAITDAVVRVIPGVIGDEQSALSDSFQDNLLAAPIYSRPADYKGWKVPEILLSGNEAKIKEWELNQAYERTRRLRPDLLNKKDE